MAAQKPSVPKGTRDFNPQEMSRRNYIFKLIRQVFTRYGFTQIETPAMENLSTLLGKYGDEGDKLLYKVLNSGDFLSKIDRQELVGIDSNALSMAISGKGLRYDLTVPFARYVVQHRNEITFPFRRFQVQPVWRADRPQKGRYREFYQCDADIIGSDSMINETEFVAIIDQVFSELEIPVRILVNNRKVLSGISEKLNASEKLIPLTVAIDKIDKMGLEKVLEELGEQGFSEDQLSNLRPLLDFSGSHEETILFLKEYLSGSDTGLRGVRELEEIMKLASSLQLENSIEINLSLARGLNYYTGAIFEVKARDVRIGSICGGGRYDDLTGIFGLPGVSGVGISFGADRIYDVLLQKDLFPVTTEDQTHLLFVNFGPKEQEYILPLTMKCRSRGINTEIYPEHAKMKKQMSYANARNIPFVALIGEKEMEDELVTLKDMKSGEQLSLTPDAMIKKLVTVTNLST